MQLINLAVATRLVSIAFRSDFSSVCAAGDNGTGAIAACATRSSFPQRLLIVSHRLRIGLSWAMSRTAKETDPPSAEILSSSSSSAPTVRDTATTWNSFRAKVLDNAAPKPRDAPVTRATLLLTDDSKICFG